MQMLLSYEYKFWDRSGRSLIRYGLAREAKEKAMAKARAYFAKLNSDERYWR